MSILRSCISREMTAKAVLQNTGRRPRIAREWSSAMECSKHGYVRDFVVAGDVDIKVISADNPGA